jgi:hypothetical protein
LFFAKAKEVIGKRDPAQLEDYKKGKTSGPERLPKGIMILILDFDFALISAVIQGIIFAIPKREKLALLASSVNSKSESESKSKYKLCVLYISALLNASLQ